MKQVCLFYATSHTGSRDVTRFWEYGQRRNVYEAQVDGVLTHSEEKAFLHIGVVLISYGSVKGGEK